MIEVTTSQDEVVILAEDHYQPIEIRFRNGGRVSLSVRSLGGFDNVTVLPEPGQRISMHAVNEDCVGLPLAMCGYRIGDSVEVPEQPLPADRYTVVAQG